MLPIRHIEEFVFITFFTLAGTYFSIFYFSQALIPISAYIVVRGVGKYLGGYIGTRMGKPKKESTSSMIGLTLLPQAGIAIGLVFQVLHLPQFSSNKDLILNIILGSTIVLELLGPVLSKLAFKYAGDIKL
jgi:Kef-type K+ transport system membrane component KefB